MPRSVNPTTSRTVTITFAGAATGSSTIGADVDGLPIDVEPSGSDTAAATATAWVAAAEAALSGYTFARADGVVTATSNSGRPILAIPFGDDATQSVTVSGSTYDESIVTAASTAQTGRPATGAGAGYILGNLPITRIDGAAVVNIRASLVNASGSAATAYWRLWVHSNTLGWYIDPSLETRLISDGGSSDALRTDDIVSVAVYGNRIAVELVGKASTGTDLDSGETFYAWAEVV